MAGHLREFRRALGSYWIPVTWCSSCRTSKPGSMECCIEEKLKTIVLTRDRITDLDKGRTYSQELEGHGNKVAQELVNTSEVYLRLRPINVQKGFWLILRNVSLGMTVTKGGVLRGCPAKSRGSHHQQPSHRPRRAVTASLDPGVGLDDGLADVGVDQSCVLRKRSARDPLCHYGNVMRRE